MNSSFIIPLDSPNASLEDAGGKGANLAKLMRAGFPVPPGFLIATSAYRQFCAANLLDVMIEAELNTTSLDEPAQLQSLSERLRQRFSSSVVPQDIRQDLREAYAALGAPSVAVRSSATAEDLPELSFAGQQDTYLNIVDAEALIEAVVGCWGSLWTARAIGYRARNAVPNEDLALAVVVQEMVASEASGVLFTANPLNGKRTESIIDATLGLGEALVGGLVEPDNYVVDIQSNQIAGKTLGAKATIIRSQEGGGVITESALAADYQALPDDQILALARLGQQVADHYQFPQDIEWAWAMGKLYLLQSRPITSLYPLPDEVASKPLEVMFAFAAIQGILAPMTPLGQDAIRLIFAGGASLFGIQVNQETQGFITIAGERLWGKIAAALRNPIGRKLLPRFMSAIEPSIVQVTKQLLNDPRLPRGRIRPKTLLRMARFIVPFYMRILRAWRYPNRKRREIQDGIERQIAALASRSSIQGDTWEKLHHRTDIYKEIYNGFPYAVPHIADGAAGGLIPMMILGRIASRLPGDRALSMHHLEIARGLPHNVTTEMDLALWQTAKMIKTDPSCESYIRTKEASKLAGGYLTGTLPTTAQTALAEFLEKYGMRGLGEIDIGRPRWREDPTHLIKVVQSYLKIENDSQAPAAIFARGEQAAEIASRELESAVRQTRAGRFKALVVRWAAVRFRALAGLRESPKFYIIRLMGVIRAGLLDSGEDLVREGVLEAPDDLFYLYLTELEALVRQRGESDVHRPNGLSDLSAVIARRRANYQREFQRKQIPKVLLSDGQAFYEGISAPVNGQESILAGSPVSPGVVEGNVRVVYNPQSATLLPGEILVCPGTDPAWTPLFLAAGGLVMEVGGMMTHGSVVAREYGIPAVVGVHQATTRLKSGQRVRVNGSNGIVELLETVHANVDTQTD